MMEEDESSVKVAPESEWRLRGRQLATSASPLLMTFVAGLSYFHSAPPEKLIVPRLMSDRAESSLGKFVDSLWILPGNVLPMILSSLLTGVLMDKFGRKLILVFICPLFIAGWLTVGFSSTERSLAIGRLICSIPIGAISPLAPVYVSEVSDPSFRNVLLATVNLALCLGMLTSVSLDMLMHWKSSAWLFAAISFVAWCISLACKESPVWSVNSEEPDLEQWVYLRGWKSLNEFRAIVRAIKAETEAHLDSGKCSRLASRVFSRRILWPLAVTCVLFFAWYFSGFNEMALIIGLPVRFAMFGRDKLEFAVVVWAMVYLVVAICGAVLVARFSRRIMAMLSVTGAAVSLLLASISFYLVSLPPVIGYLFIGALLIFMCIGLSPLTLMFVGELFPRRFRGVGAGIAFAFSWACALVDAKMGRWILQNWTMPSVAMFYSIVMALGALFVAWKLPETKDKTLVEIEVIFDAQVEEVDPVGIELEDRGT